MPKQVRKAMSDIDLKIRELFAKAKHVVIVSHIRPDGDAIGSLLGLALALEDAGKRVTTVLEDDVDEKYSYLEGADRVRKDVPAGADCLVVVDCSDKRRTGEVLQGRVPDLVVDHHKTNLNFGRINLVLEDAEATALILAERLPEWGLNITADVANALLTGILADTLGFRTSNVGPNCLRVAADLIDKGADLHLAYHQTLVTRTAADVRYWGQALKRLNLREGLLWTSLNLDDRIQAGYFNNDDADLVNILSSVSDAVVTMVFVEQESGRVKISWRSIEGVDVSKIAFKFGGGGHAAAAGAELEGSLTGVMQVVLPETFKLINESGMRYR